MSEGDDAESVDNYADSSIWVDPASKQPLPGEVAPDNPDNAPVVSIKYQLHRFDGVWKVVSGTRLHVHRVDGSGVRRQDSVERRQGSLGQRPWRQGSCSWPRAAGTGTPAQEDGKSC